MLFAEFQKRMASPWIELRRGLKPKILAYILPPEVLIILLGEMNQLAARSLVWGDHKSIFCLFQSLAKVGHILLSCSGLSFA